MALVKHLLDLMTWLVLAQLQVLPGKVALLPRTAPALAPVLFGLRLEVWAREAGGFRLTVKGASLVFFQKVPAIGAYLRRKSR